MTLAVLEGIVMCFVLLIICVVGIANGPVEMESSGIADAIRAEEGNLQYEYFQPFNDPEIVLLIDSWSDPAIT